MGFCVFWLGGTMPPEASTARRTCARLRKEMKFGSNSKEFRFAYV
jgi:hypothetical protein